MSRSIDGAPSNVSEGGAIGWTVSRTWSDSCVDDDTGNSTVADDCTGGGGSATADQIPCGAGGICTISAPLATDAVVTVDDNETVLSIDLVPVVGAGGTVNLGYGATVQFGGTVTWSDLCEEAICGHAEASWTDPGGCGTLDTVSCLYTAPGGDCGETIQVAIRTGSDLTNINVAGAIPPVIVEVFPFDFAARFTDNSHTDQGISILYDPAEGDPDATTITCTSASGVVNYTCDGGFPEEHCDPIGALDSLMDYSCDISACNGAACDNSRTGEAMRTSLSPIASEGGLGEGYIGGNHATWPTGPGSGVADAGTVDIALIDFEELNAVGVPCYAQIVQGATLTERYTNASGVLAVSLDPLPIDELTLGCKCGKLKCDFTATDSYDNYRYLTYQDVDARDMVIRMELMSYASGFENIYNPSRKGRNRVTYIATVPESSFSTYIAPQPSSVRLRPMFSVPVKLRAAFAMMSLRSVYALDISLLMAGTDEEVSIALCVLDDNDPAAIAVAAALPPNIVIPELLRTNWSGDNPCLSWGNNPPVYTYKLWHWVPNDTHPIEILGAYANATNFSLSVLAGGLDLFAFPIYLCGMGTKLVTTPDLAVTGDVTTHLGETPLEWDVRETWNKGDLSSPGYNPPDGLDKRVVMNIGPMLPIDPARLHATSSAALAASQGDNGVPLWSNAPYTDPNRTNANRGWSDWDARWTRKNVLNITGAFGGLQPGMLPFGLQMNAKVDDVEFTTFQVGYMRSTGAPVMGNQDLAYDQASSPDSQIVSRELTLIDPSETDDDAFDFTPRGRGGPTFYAAVSIMMRGNWNENSDVVTSPHYSGGKQRSYDDNTGAKTNPGTVIAVRYAGPSDSTTLCSDPGWTPSQDCVNLDNLTDRNLFVGNFLKMPEIVSPAADEYLYPAPQWSSTIGSTTPTNRNGEIQRVLTAASPAQEIQKDGGRRYFEFTVPTFMQTTKRPDSWLINLTCPEVWRVSAKADVSDDDAVISGNALYDDDAMFKSQGVAVGDNISVAGWNGTVSAVVSQTELTLSGSPGNGNYVSYTVTRATPRGNCIFDEWYSVPGMLGGGGGCSPVKFWNLMGPVPESGNTLRVHIPEVTPGSRTLDGVPGIVPDPYEGHLAQLENGNTMSPIGGEQMEWTAALIVYGTQEVVKGGLGGAWDWNNQNFWTAEFAISDNSQDGNYFIWK